MIDPRDLLKRAMQRNTMNKMRLITPNPALAPGRTLGPARNRLNRRAFLRGAGTAGLVLPFLESIPERSAFAQDEKPRFGLFVVTSCGVVGNKFWPGATGELTTQGLAGDTNKAVSILADHADRLLMIGGVDLPGRASGCAHADGLAKSLTSGNTTGGGNQVTASSVSCDTVIAQGLGVSPLTLYAGLKDGYINEKLSFSAPGQVRAAEGNPYNVYLDLAGLVSSDPGTGTGSGGGTPVADYLAMRRKSVNDLVREDLKRLLSDSRLSSADRARLDAHLTNIRDIENNMMDMGEQMADYACSEAALDKAALDDINSGRAYQASGRQEDVVKLHMELTAIAFACNTTRVATIQAGDGTDGTRYTINGELYERFHHISHRVNSDGGSGSAIANAEEKHHNVDRLRIETLKFGIEKWEQYGTPAGPLLDNGFIYWSSHVSDGPSHSFRGIPVIIAGNAGGYLKQGSYVNAGNVSVGMVLNTLINANGVQSANFGEGGNGQLDEMLA